MPMPRLSRDSKDPAVQRLIAAKDRKRAEAKPNALPSDFCDVDVEIGIDDSIAWDTETSGLFADDGARVSTASIAFAVFDDKVDTWIDWARQYGNVTVGYEEIAPEYEVFIVSCAWPFDQGREGKPEDDGQQMLWAEADNLDQDEWVALLGLLQNHLLDAHNAKFDLEKMRVGCRRWPGVGVELEANVVWDTQNVNALLYPLFPTSLKPTCARIFGKEWADEGALVKQYLQKSKLPAGRWDLMPWSAIGKYADTDARITKMLKLRQIWDINQGEAGQWLHKEGDFPGDRDPRDAVYDKVERRLEVMKVLYRMERRGVPYPEVDSRIAADECRRRAAIVAKDLPFTPSPDNAKNYFFSDKVTDKGAEGLNMIPYAVTEKKGDPQLTAEIVLRMVDDRVPFADKWDEYRRVSNAASMWYEGYADAMGTDGRLRTCFRQNGTRSSRFSVERVNLQAIPQDYRLSDHSALDGIPTPRQLIAKAVTLLDGGWRLFELDLAQAELRVGTMFAKCRLMEQMIRDGEDLHTFTTKALFPQVSPDDPLFHSKWRQVGKRGNFSLQFGAKGPTFRKMVSKETGIILSDSESDRIVRDWNALYPEFDQAITKHQNVVVKRQNRFGHGWVELVNGERRWFQQYEEAHKAFNQRVQGNLAQFGIDWMLMSDAMLRNDKELHRKAKKDGIGEAGLVLTIHDSQVLLLPDNDYGEELAATCARYGKELWARTFPQIPGDVDYHSWSYEQEAS